MSGWLEEDRAFSKNRDRSGWKSEEADFIHQWNNYMVIVRRQLVKILGEKPSLES